MIILLVEKWPKGNAQVVPTGQRDGCNGGSNHCKRLWIREEQDAFQELNSLIGLEKSDMGSRK